MKKKIIASSILAVFIIIMAFLILNAVTKKENRQI